MGAHGCRHPVRLETLGTAWLDYLDDPELRGGCFFAAAMFELGAQPGPLRDLLRDDMRRWVMAIETMIEDSQAAGEIVGSVDPGDEAFTLFSTGVTANAMIQLGILDRPADRARRLWSRHLDRLTGGQRRG